MKARLSSSSLFLPEEVAANAISVDFQQDPMVGFCSSFQSVEYLFQDVHLLVVFHGENVP